MAVFLRGSNLLYKVPLNNIVRDHKLLRTVQLAYVKTLETKNKVQNF